LGYAEFTSVCADYVVSAFSRMRVRIKELGLITYELQMDFESTR